MSNSASPNTNSASSQFRIASVIYLIYTIITPILFYFADGYTVDPPWVMHGLALIAIMVYTYINFLEHEWFMLISIPFTVILYILFAYMHHRGVFLVMAWAGLMGLYSCVRLNQVSMEEQ